MSDFTASDLPPALLSSAAILKVNDMVVTSKMQDVLRDASNCTDIKYYIGTKAGWIIDIMNQVQWAAIGSMVDSISLFNKVRALKFQHNWLSRKKHLHTFYPLDSSLCPICTAANEDWLHLFQCKHETTCSAQIHMIAKL
eukprot:14567537-Ditylum_brightwellii.AAC.2